MENVKVPAFCDANRYEVLCKQMLDPLLKLAKKVTKNKHTAEDAVQEAFMKAQRHRLHFYDEQHFRRWMALATRHSSRDYVRKAERYSFLEDHKPFWYNVPADQYIPEIYVFKAEKRSYVAGMVNTLKPIYRLIIIDKYFYDLSYQEISAATGIKEATLRSHCHRALNLLRELYT